MYSIVLKRSCPAKPRVSRLDRSSSTTVIRWRVHSVARVGYEYATRLTVLVECEASSSVYA